MVYRRYVVIIIFLIIIGPIPPYYYFERLDVEFIDSVSREPIANVTVKVHWNEPYGLLDVTGYRLLRSAEGESDASGVFSAEPQLYWREWPSFGRGMDDRVPLVFGAKQGYYSDHRFQSNEGHWIIGSTKRMQFPLEPVDTKSKEALERFQSDKVFGRALENMCIEHLLKQNLIGRDKVMLEFLKYGVVDEDWILGERICASTREWVLERRGVTEH